MRNVVITILTLGLAHFPEHGQLTLEPCAVSAHHQVHANRQTMAQWQRRIHGPGNFLGNILAAKHPDFHGLCPFADGVYPTSSRHLRSSMRARYRMTQQLFSVMSRSAQISVVLKPSISL
jgi:hypothetical protein